MALGRLNRPGIMGTLSHHVSYRKCLTNGNRQCTVERCSLDPAPTSPRWT